MGTRHPNPRLVKIHRTHSVEQLATLFGLHINTVRAWRKQGLAPIDDGKPMLFHGQSVADFLHKRRDGAKRPCQPGQIFCLPCRAPKSPAGDMAEFRPLSATTGNLSGICPDCERLIYRRVNLGKIAAIAGNLDVTFTEAPSRIRE